MPDVELHRWVSPETTPATLSPYRGFESQVLGALLLDDCRPGASIFHRAGDAEPRAGDQLVNRQRSIIGV